VPETPTPESAETETVGGESSAVQVQADGFESSADGSQSSAESSAGQSARESAESSAGQSDRESAESSAGQSARESAESSAGQSAPESADSAGSPPQSSGRSPESGRTETLPLVSLTSGVILPGMVFTLALETDEARAAVEAAGTSAGRLVLVPRIEGRYSSVGVVAEIMETGELPGGSHAAVVRGLDRATIGTAVPGTGSALWIQVDPVTRSEPSEQAVALAREYRAVLENILLGRGAGRMAERLRDITDPHQISDISGYSPDLSLAQKVEVLETLDLDKRLRKVLGWARDTLADLTLRERVKSNVEEGIERTQREFLLRRQLEAIRKELNELDGTEEGSPDGYRAQIEELDVPEGVRKAVIREIDKLERTSEQSPEHGWIRTWLDTVFEIPWGVQTDDFLDVKEAGRILDEDHDGLVDVKQRILEHLAVLKLKAERGVTPVGPRGSGAILALVGPPGVGKTSLGESVARALGRKFVRVALGGVRDEAEIRGHRRTYVGAQPGRFVRALREAGSMNPVLLLDEVDKLGSDYRGDPSSALLEVLDPAQNHTFRDHYLEVDLDLSKVLFIATANVAETIPSALLDRMEVIRLDGYTEDEKLAIARHHLLPRQLERAALRPDEVEVTDAALQAISADYTREAGVRSLERELGKLLRKVATKLAAGDTTKDNETKEDTDTPQGDGDTPEVDGATERVVVDAPDVRGWLGRPRFFFEAADRTSVPGVATGLAVTGAGGDVLFVEATSMDGTEGLTITGQLGDVMKESAEIALSYVRSHAEQLGISPDRFKNRHFHLHVPAGAVPKDGPSAGVTMTSALVSLLTDVPVRSTVGMTGEVTLQGRVLPIGGLKQKVLAAHRAGLKEVVLPERNGPDLEDVPEAVRAEMTFHLAAEVGDVLAAALRSDTDSVTNGAKGPEPKAA
jgi:ATP-dependent Lon protease